MTKWVFYAEKSCYRLTQLHIVKSVANHAANSCVVQTFLKGWLGARAHQCRCALCQRVTLQAGGYGEEVKFGGSKTIRDGMAQSQRTRDCAGNGPHVAVAVDACIETKDVLL